MFSYNYLCVFTLFKKEVYRFLKVGIQTVVGPSISSLLFLAVFTVLMLTGPGKYSIDKKFS